MNQPQSRQNRIINQQLNGAPLTLQKNRIVRPQKYNEQHYIWGDDIVNSYYLTLLKLLQKKEEEGIRWQTMVLKTREKTQAHLRDCLQSFAKDKDKEKQYTDQYQKRPYLGLTVEELGFKKGATLEQCTNLDLFWKRLIEITTQEFSTNKLMSYKVVKKYVKQEGIYKNFYQQQIGGLALKPKNELINSFFKNGTKQIDEESSQFLILASRICEVFFQEINSCIYSLTFIFDEQNQEYQGIRNIFAQNNTYSFLTHLWKSYCQLSQDLLSPLKSRNSQRLITYQKFKKELFTKKTKVVINLIKLSQVYLCDSEKMSAILSHENQQFHQQLVKKLDNDIIAYQKTDICSGVDSDSFSRFLIHLFFLLFPFELYIKGERNNAKINRINQQLKGIKSEPLSLVKALLVDIHRIEDNQSALFKRLKQFEQIADRGEWNAFNPHWKKWLGVFLSKFKKFIKGKSTNLSRKIVSLCKSIVAQEYHQFWGKQKRFYLTEIESFLKSAIEEDLHSTTMNYGLILPICTKLLGTINSRFTFNIIELFTEQVINNIFNSVIFSLKMESDKKRRQKQFSRIVYISNDENQHFQQEIKFICRLIELQADKLEPIQNILFANYYHHYEQINNSGALLIIKLFQIIYHTSPQTISGLKSLRYLITTINYLFLCSKTRNLVCIALAAVQSQYSNHSKILRAIVSQCYDYDSTNEMGRQIKKLRGTISYHLNCIVKISDNLEQYFPTTTQRQVNYRYRKLHQALQQQNTDYANEQIKLIKNQGGFKAVSWFYQLAKLLQSNKLLSTDLDTIRLFILKMRLKNQQCRQFANLSVIVDLLNNGSVSDTIIAILTPIFKRQTIKRVQEKYFLGLANKAFQSFMSQNTISQHLTALKYSSKSYRVLKKRERFSKEKDELYCKLSASLSIIETILRVSLQGDFVLLKKVKLFNYILDSLMGQNMHLYQLKFSIQVQKTPDFKSTLSTLLSQSTQTVEQEIETSVNLIHCIASYWHFQQRMDIDQSEHPSATLQLKGHFTRDFQLKGKQACVKDLLYYSQENILTEFTRKTDSVGVSTVSKILQFIVLLGGGKTLYSSIVLRNYPLTKELINWSGSSAVLQQFFKEILFTCTKKFATLREKQHVLQLLSVLMQQKHFGQYIRINIFRFKQAISCCRQFTNNSQSTYLLTQFLLFLNLLIRVDASDTSIRFIKSCLADPTQFGNKLVGHSQNRIGELADIDNRKSKYETFIWSLNVREAAACKISLLLFLGIVSYIISNEHESISSALCNLVTEHSSIFLNRNFNLSQDFDIVKRLQLKQSLRPPIFQNTDNYKYLIFDEVFVNAMLFNSPFSFVQNYIEQPWQVLQTCKQSEGKQTILATHRFNSVKALNYSSEALIQFYYLLLSSILERGSGGIFFMNAFHNQTKALSPQIIYGKEKAKNELSSRVLLGDKQGLIAHCLKIFRGLQNEIWSEDIDEPRDIGLTLIGQILQTIQSCISQSPYHLPECRRITQKLIIHFKNALSRFNFTVINITIQPLIKLLKKMLQLEMSRKNVSLYFESLNQCLSPILTHINLDKIKILSANHIENFIVLWIYLLNCQIQNIDCYQKIKAANLNYLDNEHRFEILQKLKQIQKCLVKWFDSPNSTPQTNRLIIEMFSRCMYLDNISTKYQVINISRPSSKPFFAKLQRISERITEQDVQLSITLNNFIEQIGAFDDSEQNRQLIRIIKMGFKSTQNRLKKLPQIKILSDIIYNKTLLGVFASLASQQNWHNQQFQQSLDKVFVILQEKVMHFQCQKVTAEQKQLQLCKDLLDESVYGGFGSIFSIYTSFSMFQLTKNYLFFLSFALKYSPSVHQLCNQTFNKIGLADQILDRIKASLMNVLAFINKFLTLLFKGQVDNILHAINLADTNCKSERMAYSFPKYRSKAAFLKNLFQSIVLISQPIDLVRQIWQKCDWNSRTDCRHSQKELIFQYQRLLRTYKECLKDSSQKEMIKYLQFAIEQIQIELNRFNV